jgi:4-alpha-glucanotransferase
MKRRSGILLHPTALPGPLRIGDFGKEAYSFIDFLVNAGQGVWQMLPLGPTGFGHSPYNALSAFAGNPALIDLQQLVDNGDLDKSDITNLVRMASDADFNLVHSLKSSLLKEAGRRFFETKNTTRHLEYDIFSRNQAYWLKEFCFFMALRDNFAGQSWAKWPEGLRTRDPQAIKDWEEKLELICHLHCYQQFVFTEQWQKLKNYANHNGIDIFGDLPIFVAYDSADVWANQRLFQLDKQGQPTAVAGVPPDYFSNTGQRWGNPLYCWEQLKLEDFNWWIRRFAHQLQYCDLIRIDHFRGFDACWSIPATEETAMNGQWEEVPGRAFFERLRHWRNNLPIIAEDLGVITPEVEKLRDDFGFPGMKILQFAFDSGPSNPYLPENYTANCVVYTGTHDNDTTLSWWQGLNKEQRDRVRKYLGISNPEMPWDMIRIAMASIANLCIFPCQDILGLGKEARFNTPGRATGNWSWQMTPKALNNSVAERLRRLTEKYQRVHGCKTC